MMVVLLIAGIGILLAGLLGIGFGIPVKEFSFGNTMIIVGATAICTGMLMLGLWVVVGELRNIARRLAPRAAAESRGRTLLPAPAAPLRPSSAEGGFLFSRDEPGIPDIDDLETAAPPVSPHPWQDDTGQRERLRPGSSPFPDPSGEPAPPSRSGRDRLFSTPRRERDRTASARAVEPVASEAGGGEATETGAVGFENAWPKSERGRSGEAVSQRRSGRASSSFNDSTGEDRSAASIIKSGVVDGMAYSLYSDGSIEAQMPEGMMRFNSIDELRAHLDQR